MRGKGNTGQCQPHSRACPPPSGIGYRASGMAHGAGILYAAAAVLTGLLISACDILGASPSAEPTVPVVARDVRADLQPLSDEQCNELANNLKQFNVPVTVEQAPFQDQIAGNLGTGCLVLATGTGVQFTSVQSVTERVRLAMSAQSWQEDPNYSAIGPIGIATAFRKDTALCLFSVGWQPDWDVVCPSDRPLTECPLPADEKLYDVALQCVR